jgi:hypothetical protein
MAEESPKDRRVPLAAVVFNTPTAIPGAPLLMTSLVTGEARTMAGATFTCPQAFFDPALRTIYIEGREYPMERVHYWERARMAKQVKPASLVSYTIGKQPRVPAPSKKTP